MAKQTKTLILTIEVPDIWADDLPESAQLYAESTGDGPSEPTPRDYHDVVVEEWMDADVGLTVLPHVGEKNLNSDRQMMAYNARIVGAAVRDRKHRDDL